MICFRKDVKDLFTGHEVTDAEAHNWCTDSGTKLDKLEENLNNYQTYSSNTKNLPTDLPNDWKNPEFKTFTWDTGEASVANRKNYRVTGVWIKIKTSDDNHGGTDSTIHAGFKNLSPSNGWHLDKSEDHTDKFETGHWDRFKKTFDKAYSLNDFTRPGCEFWLKGTDMSDSDAWTIDKMRVYLEVSSWKVGEQGIYHLIYFRDQDKNITTSSKKYFIFNHSPGSFVDNSDWNDFIQ
jgi:hypothetical protein